MQNIEIINSVANSIHQKFNSESGGHDWWHTWRVWQLARQLALKENANLFIVELSALLHDVADWKYSNGDHSLGGKTSRMILANYPVSGSDIDTIVSIVDSVSFKGAGVPTPMDTIEGMIVQDADRLDAIGAIGIARTFAYGGMKGRLIYDPDVKPRLHQSFDEYKDSSSPTINHFYEKLLLLKDSMNTESAKQIALKRHTFMENFLDQFFGEFNFVLPNNFDL